jgi:hypothetical protein
MPSFTDLVISLEDSRNSRNAFPTDLPIWGSFDGPKMIRATSRMRPSSGSPNPWNIAFPFNQNYDSNLDSCKDYTSFDMKPHTLVPALASIFGGMSGRRKRYYKGKPSYAEKYNWRDNN